MPLYMSSRHIKFVDSGLDRNTVLEELFDFYMVSQGCPVLDTRDAQGAKSISLERISSDSTRWNTNYRQAMLNRRSKRAFHDQPLDKTVFISIIEIAMARLFETVQSKSKVSEIEKYTKSYGCAFNIYLLIYSVSDFARGIYIINKDCAMLTLIKSGDFSSQISTVNWGMRAPLSANYSVVLTVDPSVYAWRYRHDRSFRNLMVEAGRIMHEFVLSASGASIQGVVTPATDDSLLSKVLDIPHHSQEIPFYTGTFGVSPSGL
ncbi:Nitroreductase family protein [compost metagenome]